MVVLMSARDTPRALALSWSSSIFICAASASASVTVNAVNGVATFSGIRIDTAGTGYRFEATRTSRFDLTLPVMQPDGTRKPTDVRTLPFVRFEDNEAHGDGGALSGAEDRPRPHPARLLARVPRRGWGCPARTGR